jgi:hypothetical protein
LHIQGIGTGSVSDSYLNDPPAPGQVPEPGTYSMILIGLGLAFVARLRPRTKEE